MHTRPGVGAQQPARRPSMPTEGGAAVHAGLVVLGLPLAYPLLGMLPGVCRVARNWPRSYAVRTRGRMGQAGGRGAS